MFRFFESILVLILLSVVGVGAYLLFWGDSHGQKSAETSVVRMAQSEISPLTALLVQVSEETGNRRIVECSKNGCVPKMPPESLIENPLSDGTSWYRYAERTKPNNSTATVLEKIDTDGKIKTITEENPLVKPRSMILSTDGSKIAYFLDNIHDKLDLTELWLYDNKEGGSKVIVEKLRRQDIASEVRWNASSRVVWFLQEKEKKELIAAPLAGGGAPRFTGVNWNEHSEAADSGVMDINDDLSLLAFAERASSGYSRLLLARNNENAKARPVKGDVVFVRWMENGNLLYAVQDGKSLAFWMANANKEWPIARMEAAFESAHSPGSSPFAAFIASPREGERHLYILEIATGLIKDQTVIPYFPGKTYLVQTSEEHHEASPKIAGSTSTIADTELVSLLEQNVQAIAESSDAKASRILMTDAPNTVFLDYTTKNTEQRVLVTIKDVVHPEWKVLAKYKTINGVWNRLDVTGTKEPKALRLYEWEEAVSQWILKQKY